MHREVEDGMGFAGLVPSKSEKAQIERNKQEHKRTWNAALASIHIPNEMAVARTADKLKIEATKVAAVWMTMLEEMKK